MASVIAIKSFYRGKDRVIRGATLYLPEEEALQLVLDGKVRMIAMEVAKKKEAEPVICSGLKHAASPVAPASPKKTAKKSGSGAKEEPEDASL